MSISCDRTTSCKKCPEFFPWHTLASNLSDIYDPIPYLQMFTDRLRVRSLAANIMGVNKRTLEGYLCNMADIFTGMGVDDPRLDVLGKIGFLLSWQLCDYAQAYPPWTASVQYPPSSYMNYGVTYTPETLINKLFMTYSP